MKHNLIQPPTQAITDQHRRAFVRYCKPITSLIAEFAPSAIQIDLLQQPFSTADLHHALTEMGVKVSRERLAQNLEDEFSPIVDKLAHLKQEVQHYAFQHVRKYVLHTRAEMEARLTEIAYARETERQFADKIPAMHILEDQLPAIERAFLRETYGDELKEYYASPEFTKAASKAEFIAEYFTRFDLDRRTPFDIAVTTPKTLKIAFFRSQIKREGTYSIFKQTLLTGMDGNTLRRVRVLANCETETRRLVVMAKTAKEAVMAVKEPAKAIRLNAEEYMLQLRSKLIPGPPLDPSNIMKDPGKSTQLELPDRETTRRRKPSQFPRPPKENHVPHIHQNLQLRGLSKILDMMEHQTPLEQIYGCDCDACARAERNRAIFQPGYILRFSQHWQHFLEHYEGTDLEEDTPKSRLNQLRLHSRTDQVCTCTPARATA